MDTKFLTREQILAADDLQTEEVNIPEWGGVVLVRALSGAERDALEASMVRKNGKSMSVNMDNFRAKLVSMCVINESGKRIFTQADVKELSKKSASALDKIFGVAQRLSGLSGKDVGELMENLSLTPREEVISD